MRADPDEIDQSDRAYATISEAIVAGRFKPGDRLVEAEIARRAGVSRTPARQALRRLEREGVVVIEKRRGAKIRELTSEQIDDLYALRAQLEAFACRLAAERATNADHLALEALAERFETAVEESSNDDDSSIHAANAALHQKLTSTARNPYLAMAVTETIENPLVLAAFRRFGEDELARSALFHRLIVEAVCQGQGDRASRLMAEHVLQARDALLSVNQSLASASNP